MMTLTEQAYDALRRDIIRGTLAPDTPLRMADLSARYGMGFSPLREALSRLNAERLVVSEPLRGFKVAPLSVQGMRDAMSARILIEGDALRAAIALGDDDWAAQVVSALYALKLQVERPDPDPWALEARHYAFHRALLAACASPWRLEFFDRLYAATERYRVAVLTGRTSGAGRDIQAEHTELAEAALARHADLAVSLLTAHYQRTADFVAGTMGQTP